MTRSGNRARVKRFNQIELAVWRECGRKSAPAAMVTRVEIKAPDKEYGRVYPVEIERKDGMITQHQATFRNGEVLLTAGVLVRAETQLVCTDCSHIAGTPANSAPIIRSECRTHGHNYERV